MMRKQVGNDHIYKYQWLDKCEDVHHYALDADVNLCTSVLVSLLSQMTTPAVPMAALSPMVLTRSACQEEIIQRRCKRVAAQQAVFFFSACLFVRDIVKHHYTCHVYFSLKRTTDDTSTDQTHISRL